jgi:hypothetical protein
VFPVVIKALNKEMTFITASTALFLINQICSTITYKPIIEATMGMIFLPRVKNEWTVFVDEYPINVPQYSYIWSDATPDFTLVECKAYPTYRHTL